MIKYAQVAITPVSGAETMAGSALVIGVKGKNRRITGIWAEGTDTIHLRCYKEGERLVDIDTQYWVLSNAMLPLDVPLAEGEQFKVGLYSSSGTTAQYIIAQYEE